MVRPRAEHPTTAELEILKVLWGRSRPATVRRVLEAVNRLPQPPRAYTSVMSLLNVMTEKGWLRRVAQGRAFVYEPAAPRDQTLRLVLGETLERAYSGSACLLVSHLLEQSAPSAAELDQIRSLLDGYQRRLADEADAETKEGGSACKTTRWKRSPGC